MMQRLIEGIFFFYFYLFNPQLNGVEGGAVKTECESSHRAFQVEISGQQIDLWTGAHSGKLDCSLRGPLPRFPPATPLE